jgi:hypothetical protein
MNALVGKWLTIDTKDSYYLVAVVEADLGNGFVLVRDIPPKNNQPRASQIFSTADLVGSHARVFSSKEELEAYVAWMDEPPDDNKPKIVPMHRQH